TELLLQQLAETADHLGFGGGRLALGGELAVIATLFDARDARDAERRLSRIVPIDQDDLHLFADGELLAMLGAARNAELTQRHEAIALAGIDEDTKGGHLAHGAVEDLTRLGRGHEGSLLARFEREAQLRKRTFVRR